MKVKARNVKVGDVVVLGGGARAIVERIEPHSVEGFFTVRYKDDAFTESLWWREREIEIFEEKVEEEAFFEILVAPAGQERVGRDVLVVGTPTAMREDAILQATKIVERGETLEVFQVTRKKIAEVTSVTSVKRFDIP